MDEMLEESLAKLLFKQTASLIWLWMSSFSWVKRTLTKEGSFWGSKSFQPLIWWLSCMKDWLLNIACCIRFGNCFRPWLMRTARSFLLKKNDLSFSTLSWCFALLCKEASPFQERLLCQDGRSLSIIKLSLLETKLPKNHYYSRFEMKKHEKFPWDSLRKDSPEYISWNFVYNNYSSCWMSK